jgi:hypothetical protein
MKLLASVCGVVLAIVCMAMGQDNDENQQSFGSLA